MKISSKARKRPNFAARLKRIYGEKTFSDNIAVEERHSRLRSPGSTRTAASLKVKR